MTAYVRFSAKRKLALEAFLLGSTAKDAARTAGVAEKTARRWLSEPSFAAALAGSARRDAGRHDAPGDGGHDWRTRYAYCHHERPGAERVGQSSRGAGGVGPVA